MREVAVGTDQGEEGEEQGEGPGSPLSNKLCEELQAALKNGRYWAVKLI